MPKPSLSLGSLGQHHTVLHPDILQVRAPAICFYVLRDSLGLYVLDGGFIGGRFLLRRALRQRGWHNEPILGIIITHGHLDHILNVSKLAEEFGAWIAAPRLDSDHYTGHARYLGRARVTGLLECIGRPLLSFEPFTPSRFLDDLDFLDVWHVLQAVLLPGHTHGHMGFYCASLKLMFSADLFASYGWSVRFPPDVFNSVPEQIPRSAARAVEFDLVSVLPNHCDHAKPDMHLARLEQLLKKTTAA